jgi:hypothetical protein
MIKGIDAKGLQTIEVDFLNVERRRFDDDLILIIVLEAIGILTISTIGWTARWFNISHPPWLRAQDPEEGCRVESPGTYLNIIRLLNHTSLICPESLKGKDQLLKIHPSSSE